MGRKPRFFCDNCAVEVGSRDRACPRCGRVFASVRCPGCGFVGGDDDFADGCPACGYSAAAGGRASAKPPRERQPPLPFWAIFLAAGAFALAFALLLLTLS